jgi:stage V sporulation protein D (sporulation-specific penicillin-binding protein)
LRGHDSRSAEIKGRTSPVVRRDAAGRLTAEKNKKQNTRQYKRGGKAPVIFLMTVLIVFASFLVFRLYKIQILDYEVNAEKAARLHFREVTEQPRRGSILDRNGVELAGTTYVYRIGITPSDVKSITLDISKQEIAEGIASVLKLETESVLAEMGKTDQSYVQLKKDVPGPEADQLKSWLAKNDIGGVRIDDEPRRYYTNGSLASQVIGFANYDSNTLFGQLGLELQYNSILTGQPGYKYVETDNYSQGDLPFSVPTSLGAQHGNNLQINLDINIQKIVQEELERAIGIYDITEGGSAIVMDPYTGSVLAMASYPFFDSTDPTVILPDTKLKALDQLDISPSAESDEEMIEFLSSQIWRNRAISDTYEPGSTMKSLTAAVAFEEGLASEPDLFDDSPMQVLDWTISCAKKAGHGVETLEQGFWRSCNPVFAQLAQRAGVSRYYSYMQSFGFMNTTGIDLPAEGVGILHESPTELDMVTLSYGESSTLTPIQMLTAFGAFANGGNLMKPTVLKTVLDSDGSVIKDSQPETIRKIMSETTAARIRELLKGVVLYGTGSAAYVEGYSVGGKTSTSTDDFGDHTISFAALAPTENPEIVVLIVLQKPADKATTSTGAARACGQIIGRTLEYLGVAREYSEQDISRLSELHAVPDVVGMTYAEANRVLGVAGMRAEAGEKSMGDQTVVRKQWPESGSSVHVRSLIYLYPADDISEDLVSVPDFTGKTVHESLLSANNSGLNILIDGDCLGVVVRQEPKATYSSGAQNEITQPGNVQPAEPDDKTNEIKQPEIDPDTGNPVQTRPGRVQRGSQIRLYFEPVSENYEDSALHEQDSVDDINETADAAADEELTA